MTTYAVLLSRCRTSLNDAGHITWDAETLLDWLNDAIRDYSQHFPRIRTQTISATAGDHTYDLAGDFMGLISVEYPTGQDPPAYLSRLPYTHPDFRAGENWYDIVARGDDSAASELWISAGPAGTESIQVMYNAHHALAGDTASLNDETTIPQPHQHLLNRYILWQATLHLLFAEQQSPTSNSSLLMSQLSQDARRLEAGYHTALRQALYAADGRSRPVPWLSRAGYSRHDANARVY